MKNSGKDDPEAIWSMARKEEVLQFQEMRRLGELPDDHPDIIKSPFKRLVLLKDLFMEEGGMNGNE